MKDETKSRPPSTLIMSPSGYPLLMSSAVKYTYFETSKDFVKLRSCTMIPSSPTGSSEPNFIFNKEGFTTKSTYQLHQSQIQFQHDQFLQHFYNWSLDELKRKQRTQLPYVIDVICNLTQRSGCTAVDDSSPEVHHHLREEIQYLGVNEEWTYNSTIVWKSP